MANPRRIHWSTPLSDSTASANATGASGSEPSLAQAVSRSGNERDNGGRSTAAVGEVIGVLVLTRKPDQSIMIGDDVEIVVLSAAGGKVRLGIRAPTEVPVYRTEIYNEIQRERGAGAAGETRMPT